MSHAQQNVFVPREVVLHDLLAALDRAAAASLAGGIIAASGESTRRSRRSRCSARSCGRCSCRGVADRPSGSETRGNRPRRPPRAVIRWHLGSADNPAMAKQHVPRA
jgi:hypothetical protein